MDSLKTLVLLLVVRSATLASSEQTQTISKSGTLPDFYSTRECRQNTTDRNICIKRYFQEIIPLFNHADRLGLPKFDPYFIGPITTDLKAGPIRLHAHLSNVTVTGFSNATVRGVRSELKQDLMDIQLDLDFPTLRFLGNFEVKSGTGSRIGAGPVDVLISHVRSTWKMRGRRSFGKSAMSITRASAYYDVGGLKLWAKGIIDGFPQLDQFIINLSNRFWREVVDVGRPFVQGRMDEEVHKIMTSIFHVVTYDQLLTGES